MEVCWPTPQLAVQGLHWDQADHWQSTASTGKEFRSAQVHRAGARNFTQLQQGQQNVMFEGKKERGMLIGIIFVMETKLGSNESFYTGRQNQGQEVAPPTISK